MLSVKVVKRKVLAGEEAGQEKWYGQVVSGSKITFEKICKQVSHHCTATYADVSVVVKEVLEHVTDLLAEGNIVQLGRLGNVRLNAGSKGVEEEGDFTLRLMKKPRVVFAPGSEFRTMLRDVKFRKEKAKVVVVPKACEEEHV